MNDMRCFFLFLIAQGSAQNLKSLISLSQILDAKPSIATNGHINIIDNSSSSYVDEVTGDTISDSIQLCYLPYLIRFSVDGEPDNKSGSYEGMAAVSLALEHLNTGNGVITPEITNINQRCPLQFYSDSFDTKSKPAEGLDQLVRLTDPDPQKLVPFAILGAGQSSISMSTASYSSLRDLVQISPVSTSTLLDDEDQYPLFGRTIPSDDGTPPPLLALLTSWNVNHIAIVHTSSAYGISFADAIVKHAAPALNISKFGIINSEADDRVISNAVRLLKGTQFRYFFAVISETTLLDKVMTEAYKQGIAGTGLHTWLFSDGSDGSVAGRSFPLGSPLAKAYKGTGVLRATGGMYGIDAFDHLTLAMQELKKFQEDMSFLNSHLPIYPEGASVNHSEVTSQDTFLANPGYVAPFVYDAVIALGLAACNLTSKRENFTGQDLYQAFVETEFEGASGSVEFIVATGSRTLNSTLYSLTNFVIDDNTDGEVKFKRVETHLYKSNRWENHYAFIFSDGTHVIPPELPPLEYNPNYLSIPVKAAGLLLCAIIIALSISFGLWTYHNRGVQAVRASQPIFLYVISSGTLLMGSAIIPMSIDEGWTSKEGADAACMAFPWLFFIGWSLTFSALFTKTWRIKKIMQSAAKFKRIKLAATDVMKPMIALLFFNVIVLTVWTIIDPLTDEPTNIRLDEFGRMIESDSFCGSDHNIVFASILGVVNMGSLAFSVIQAYQARKISTEFNESNYIFVAMWTILYATILGIPVLIVAHNNVAAVYFVEAGLVFAICSSILLFMFVPKVLAFRIKKDTNTPVNRWQKPVEGKPAGESHEIEGVLDSDNGSGIRITFFGISELRRENLELKKLVESYTKRFERNHETEANHGDQNPALKEKQTATLVDKDNREQYNTNLHGVDELEQTHEPLANHGEHIPD